MENIVMRVCRIITRLNTGGPALQVEVLNKLPVETLVLSGRLENGEHGREGCIRTLGRAVRPWNDWKAYREIRRRLKEFKPDIVHTHTAKAGVLGRLAAWRLGIRCVHTYHGHTFYGYFSVWKTWLGVHMERLLSKVSSRLIAISPSQRDDILKWVRPKKGRVVVIPNGFDLAPFQKEVSQYEARRLLDWDPNMWHILFVGRLVPVKSVETFIEIAKASLWTKAVVVGDGPERDKLPSWIIHIPYTDTETMNLIYRASDMLYITSKNEGIPTTYIEATVCGLPIQFEAVGGLIDLMFMTREEILETYQADRLRKDILTLYKEVLK